MRGKPRGSYPCSHWEDQETKRPRPQSICSPTVIQICGEALLFCRFDISWPMASIWTPATMHCGVAVLVWKPATFEVVTAKSRCRKDYLPCCVSCLAHVGPVFYARGIWADLQSGDRYGLLCANGFGRRRDLFSTTHDAPLIRIPTMSNRWPDNSLRVTTAVCRGAFADCTRPVCISYQFYFVPWSPCVLLLCASHLTHLSCQSPHKGVPMGSFSHDLVET